MSEEVLPINQLNTPIQKMQETFQGQERDSYKLSSNITQNFSISTTSRSGNFQILNTKVHIDEEILKTTTAPKWMQKEWSHNSTNKWKTRSQNKLIAKN